MVSMVEDVSGPRAPYLGESRARVLHALQSGGKPMGVSDIARKVGLHPNTARFHLDALTDSHLATRHREERDVPGRPRWLYSAGPSTAHTGRRSYQLLAQVLSSSLSLPKGDAREKAAQAGREWGRKMVAAPEGGRSTDAPTATRNLHEVLDEIGFGPEVTDGGAKVLLHQCPFREAVATNQEVVCAVHLGLMRGVLDTLHTTVQAADLLPFVEPDLCVTHLTRKNAS